MERGESIEAEGGEYLQPGLSPYGGFADFSPVFEEGFA